MCDNFAPQAWRKERCQHCFQDKDEHTIVETREELKDNRPIPKVVNLAKMAKRDTDRNLRTSLSPPPPPPQAQALEDDAHPWAAAADIGAAAAAGNDAGIVNGAAAVAAGPGHPDPDENQAAAQYEGAAIGGVAGAAAAADYAFDEDIAAAMGEGEAEGVGEEPGGALEAFGPGPAVPPPPPPPPAPAPAPAPPADGDGEALGAAEGGHGGDMAEQNEGGAAAGNAGGNMAAMLAGIRGGTQLRRVPMEELQRERENREPDDIMSEMQKRQRGRTQKNTEQARQVIDSHQSDIEQMISALNGLYHDMPRELSYLKSLCREADKLKESVMKKMTPMTDLVLQQRVSWPLDLHQSLSSVVTTIELIESSTALVQDLLTKTQEAGVDQDNVPIVNPEAAASALDRLITNIHLLRRGEQQQKFAEVHASQAGVSLLLEESTPPCIHLLDCLFARAMHTVRSLSEIGVSRYTLTFRVNHASKLLVLVCRMNDQLTQCLGIPHHDHYSDAQLAIGTLKEKYSDMQTFHNKTGEWDKKEEVKLRSSTKSRPPVRTRLTAKAAFEQDAVSCVAEDRQDDFRTLIGNCQLSQIEAVHSPLVLAAVSCGNCETVSWVISALRTVDNYLTPSREFDWLHGALTKDSLPVLKHLVESCGFDVNCRSKDMGNTILHAATRRQDITAVLLLMELGADVMLINSAMHTPLMTLGLKYFASRPLSRPKQETNDCFSSYVNNPNLSDVVLVCEGDNGTQEKCFAHRILLCGHSAFFKSMLDTEHWAEASQREVALGSVRYAVLLVVLEYIYTGACFFPYDDIALGAELLEAANQFRLTGMAQQVEFVLCNKITTETAIPLYSAAHLYSSSSLLHELCHFILVNYSSISDPDHEILLHILKHQKPLT